MNAIITATEYRAKFNAFNAGEITRAEWEAVVAQVLAQELDKVKDVLQRLKDRWRIFTITQKTVCTVSPIC